MSSTATAPALSPIESSLPLPPWVTNPKDQWVSVKEYAGIMRRSTRTVYEWLTDGTLIAFKVESYRDPRGRWWIKV